jgi:hypothetical protein
MRFDIKKINAKINHDRVAARYKHDVVPALQGGIRQVQSLLMQDLPENNRSR